MSHTAIPSPPTDWRDHLTFAYLQEPPFCFRNSDGVARGCDVELAEAVLRAAGMHAFVPVEAVFADLLPGLLHNRWLMTTGLFITEARLASVDFSRPIWALHDGLLVSSANASKINGYRSVARDGSALLGVIVDQVQHTTALRLGMPSERIRQFKTQDEAATAVAKGHIAAYASVAMAHRGYLASHPYTDLSIVDIDDAEQPPAFGAFAFAKTSGELKQAVDHALNRYLGSPEHRTLMLRYGFTSAEIDRVVKRT